jgi:hypothetical protein
MTVLHVGTLLPCSYRLRYRRSPTKWGTHNIIFARVTQRSGLQERSTAPSRCPVEPPTRYGASQKPRPAFRPATRRSTCEKSEERVMGAPGRPPGPHAPRPPSDDREHVWCGSRPEDGRQPAVVPPGGPLTAPIGGHAPQPTPSALVGGPAPAGLRYDRRACGQPGGSAGATGAPPRQRSASRSIPGGVAAIVIRRGLRAPAWQLHMVCMTTRGCR